MLSKENNKGKAVLRQQCLSVHVLLRVPNTITVNYTEILPTQVK